MPSPPKPTEAELAILRVLWKQGPSTVRQVTEALSAQRPTGYTTALKLLQIMADKGLVRRDDRERSHIYAARLSEEQTQRQLVRDLLQRAFEGSPARLVLQAIDEGTSREELREIRALIEREERNRR